MKLALRILGLLAVGVILTYITWPSISDRWSLQAGAPQYACADNGPSSHNPYNKPRPTNQIKTINLTNSGLYADRCELTDAYLDLVWDDKSRNQNIIRASNSKILSKLVVMYIHGWRHDADPKDSDFEAFSDMIKDLRDRQNGKKNVVGIYIGWNAKSLFFPLDLLTFWQKAKIADRIAQSGTVTDIVGSIGAMTKKYPQQLDQFIAIGHSFGARILFAASSQHLIAETEAAYPDLRGGEFSIVQGTADATILINPAFEASRFTALDDFRGTEASFAPSQNPLIVVIASEQDTATQYAFPLGQWLGGERQDKEITTVGNYQDYFTHHLVISSEDGCYSNRFTNPGDLFKANNICLIRDRLNERNKDHNPFIVAEASKDVIPGHNEIWSPRFSSFLFQFVSALSQSVIVAKMVEGDQTARSLSNPVEKMSQ